MEESQGDTQLVQIRVCTEIAIECCDFNPAKRPDMQDIIDRLGATPNADVFATETGSSSSSSVPKVSSCMEVLIQQASQVLCGMVGVLVVVLKWRCVAILLCSMLHFLRIGFFSNIAFSKFGGLNFSMVGDVTALQVYFSHITVR